MGVEDTGHPGPPGVAARARGVLRAWTRVRPGRSGAAQHVGWGTYGRVAPPPPGRRTPGPGTGVRRDTGRGGDTEPEVSRTAPLSSSVRSPSTRKTVRSRARTPGTDGCLRSRSLRSSRRNWTWTRVPSRSTPTHPHRVVPPPCPPFRLDRERTGSTYIWDSWSRGSTEPAPWTSGRGARSGTIHL